MSVQSSVAYSQRYHRLPATFVEVGHVSIPVAVSSSSSKNKRRRNRRRSNRRRDRSMLSVNKNVNQNIVANGGYRQRKDSLGENDYRSRAESFGGQSSVSRMSTRSYSRRGSSVRYDNKSDNRQYNGRYDGQQEQVLKWDRDRMSRQIWRFYQDNCQTVELKTKKNHLKEALQKILVNNFPDHLVQVHIVGSTFNGLAGNQSDMDICLVMNKIAEKTAVGPLVDIEGDAKPKTKIDSPETKSPTAETIDKLNTSADSIITASSTNGKNDESVPMLERIRDVLQGCNFVMKMQIILAKVPILKFIDRISGIEVTLNVNKTVSIRNTQLIRDYTKMDWRLQPLAMVIKAWAKDHNIKDAYNKSISSYSLVLMVIHYLQYGCDPPVLPCLQRMDPTRYAADADIREVLRKKRWTRRWQSRNTSTLKELLIGFLDYYSYAFSYENDAISVRLGHPIPKSKVHPQSFPLLSIEEPFNRSNTAHSVYDRVTFERILSVFRVSHYTLRRYPFLNSIMAGRKFANETVGRQDSQPISTASRPQSDD